MFDLYEAFILMNHTSNKSLFITILIVFGSVLSTLSYVAWKRYDYSENGSNFIDKNREDE